MPPATLNPSAFDAFVESYEEACARGVGLSGESRDFFAQQRVAHTRRLFRDPASVRTVLDFGCGLGHATPLLWEAFPAARVVGVDTSAGSVAAAQKRYGNGRALFRCDLPAPGDLAVDLVYCNGVFHHIPPDGRKAIVRRIRSCLAPTGLFALWENNPWNPGTRLVMSRIPFDRDAVILSCWEAQSLLRAAGLNVLATRFHFYFPALLRPLRALEPYLERLPLGAQYCVVGQQPAAPAERRARRTRSLRQGVDGTP